MFTKQYSQVKVKLNEKAQRKYTFVSENISDLTDENTMSPLSLACEQGDIAEVNRLLQDDADPDGTDDEESFPICYAVKNSHYEVTELLLQKGADPSLYDSNGDTPLLIACENGDVKIVAFLLQHGAIHAPFSPHESESSFLLPLNVALLCNQGHVVNTLLENGVDIDSPDDNQDGTIPLLDASANGHLKIVTRLLLLGADPNVTNENGDTSLLLAAKNVHLKVVKLLLQHHATQVNKCNIALKTPLHYATKNSHLEVVKLLLQHGADPLSADKNGDTPLRIAHANKNKALFKVLKEYRRKKETQNENNNSIAQAPFLKRKLSPSSDKLSEQNKLLKT